MGKKTNTTASLSPLVAILVVASLGSATQQQCSPSSGGDPVLLSAGGGPVKPQHAAPQDMTAGRKIHPESFMERLQAEGPSAAVISAVEDGVVDVKTAVGWQDQPILHHVVRLFNHRHQTPPDRHYTPRRWIQLVQVLIEAGSICPSTPRPSDHAHNASDRAPDRRRPE